jgi:hypothetical protein
MSLARRVPATGRAGTGRSWPAWTVLALSIGLWAATLGLGRAHGPLPGVPGFDVVDVVTYSAFLAGTVVGSVIISRRPSNRIGLAAVRRRAAGAVGFLRDPVRPGGAAGQRVGAARRPGGGVACPVAAGTLTIAVLFQPARTDHTVEPTTSSLWLRPSAGEPSGP